MSRVFNAVFVALVLIFSALAPQAFAQEDLKAQINALATAKLPELPAKIQTLATTCWRPQGRTGSRGTRRR